MKTITIVIKSNDNKNIEKNIKEINSINKENVKFILIDSEEYSSNVEVYNSNKSNITKIYNKILSKLDTKYIMFLDLGTNINYNNILNKVINSKYELLFVNYYDNKSFPIKDTSKAKNLYENFDQKKITQLNLSIYNYVFSSKIIKNIKLDEKFADDNYFNFTIEANKNTNKIEIINQKCSAVNKHIEAFKIKKNWYLESLILYKEILEKNDKTFIKLAILNLLREKFMANVNSKDCHVLSEKDIPLFEKEVKDVLMLIDDKILNKYFENILTETLFSVFMKIKHGNDYDLGLGNCEVDSVDYSFNKIKIDFCFTLIERNNNKNKIGLYLNNEKIETKETGLYSFTKYFGKVYTERKTCTAIIDKKLLKNKNDIVIKTEKDHIFPLIFSKPSSKISDKLKYSYWNFDKYVFKLKNNTIKIYKNNLLYKITNEIKFLFNILFNKNTTPSFLRIKCFGLRIVYWLTRLFFHKNIWIAYDKLYKGGDNGEYFFQYATKIKDDKKIYYVINKTANDYKRLSKQKHILKYRSLHHFLCVLNAKSIFSTHANPYSYNGFAPTTDLYFRGLLTFDTFCIQHGLSVNQIAKFQNRVYANTKLYFCASPFEIKNLKDLSYDYSDEQLLLTGIPRFDGLKNNSKKQVLITPTWRQSISAETTKLNQARGHSDTFKDSVYYKIYYSLITNKKLIECAKKNNYEIIYLLHPAVAGQINDFPKDIFTKVIPSTGNMSYEQILRESDLMVTDYSGVQFDFAYMKKPIVYYHPDELPPHYEEGGLIYDKDGFGPICKTEDETVKEICKCMENGCKNDKKYVDRTTKFFKYNDFNTCKRIYDEVKKYYKNK